MKRSLILLALVLPIMLGCANVNIVSNKDAAYQNKLDRVVIAIGLEKTYLRPENVRNSFANKLFTKGVTVTSLEISPLELDSKSRIQTAIDNHKATQVLFLFTKSTVTNQYGGINAFSLDGSIVDTKTSKRIWRSEMRFTGNEMDPQKNADVFVDRVVAKLQADGLL